MTNTDLKECREARAKWWRDHVDGTDIVHHPSRLATAAFEAAWEIAMNRCPTAAPDEMLATDIAGIIEGYKCEPWADDLAMVMARHIIKFTALRRPQQPADWRPIDDAAKSGEWIILWVPGHGHCLARWSHQYNAFLSHSSGKIITMMTHWRVDLPAPPAEENGK